MGKKFFGALLLALLLSLLTQVSAWAESAVVTGDEVNMREGPGTNFRIVNCLPRGASVTVTDRSDPSWYAVEYNGRTGFMASSFLQVSEDSSQSVEAAIRRVLGDGEAGYVDAMYVRMRSAPGSEASVLGEYNRGKTLRYYGRFGDWAACIIDGKAGFIYADYIALADEGGQASSQGWDDGTSDDGELPLNLRIMETPEPTPVTVRPTSSDILSLQHASDPNAERVPGYINANYVRFRKGPAGNYPIIETYNAGTPVSVAGVYMDWVACIIDDVFGFVYSDYITIPLQEPEEEPAEEWAETIEVVEETEGQIPVPMPETRITPMEGYVSGNNVRMRAAPSMSAAIVDELSFGNALTIAGVTGDWAAVICNGKAGYIYGQFIKQGNFEVLESSAGVQGSDYQALGGSSLERGRQIAAYAVQFVGYNYCWGGRDPSTGFDCSGLVYYVYQHFGIELNRVAQDQAKNGVPVSADQLQPGDILCFYSGSSYIGHSGIYIGNGMFVHAQNSATGVVITELAGHYADRGFEARRIV